MEIKDVNCSVQNSLKTAGNRLGIYLLVLIIGIFIYHRYNAEKKYSAQVISLQKKVASVSGSKSKLEYSLKDAVRKKRAYKYLARQEGQRAQFIASQMSVLLNGQAQDKERIRALNSELERLQAESVSLKESVQQMAREKAELQGRLQSMQEGPAALMQAAPAAPPVPAVVEKKAEQMPNVELKAVTIKPSTLKGKIIKANKKYNFFIIDLGKVQGVTIGMNFMAYRDGKPIGKIVIEKTYDDLAAGRAAFDWARDVLDVGDTVKGID